MDIKDLAKYTINRCVEIGRPISNLQLQKMLYFIQGEYYRAKGCWVSDAEFYAWKFGPVNKETYKAYCGYGGGKIYERSSIVPNNIDIACLNSIIDRYANLPVRDLVTLSHKQGGAWAQSYNGDKRTKIRDTFILNEFKQN